jgi:SNF2 family DNA or RNA helicase
VVITTYDRVRAEFKKNEFNLRNIQNHGNNDTTAPTPTIEDAPLFDVEWQRIVLDESHKVRGGTMLFHSVNALKAKFKWCLSGTPFQVSLLVVV